MKKLCVVVGCISLIHFSCHKNDDLDLKTPMKVASLQSATKELVFKATQVYSKLSSIGRRIEIINKKTNALLGEVFISLGCNNPNDNLYRKLKYEPEKFSGHISFELIHQMKLTKRILNGKLVEIEKLLCNDTESAKSMNSDCLAGINSCISNTYEDMSWLSFALCTIKGGF